MTLIVDISFQKSDKSQRIVLNENDELIVGRQNEKTLLSADPRLSRRHFSIRLRGGEILIEHLSKTNPTLLAPEDSSDFQPIRGQQKLSQSCRIIAGFHRFILTLEGAQTTAQSPMGDLSGAGWGDIDDDDSDVATINHPPQAAPVTRRTDPDSGRAPFRFDDSLDDVPTRESAARQPRPAVNLFESEQPPERVESRKRSSTKARDPQTSDFFINKSQPSGSRDSGVGADSPPSQQKPAPPKPPSEPEVEPSRSSERESNPFLDFDDDSKPAVKPPTEKPTPVQEKKPEAPKSDDKKKKSSPENDFPRKLHFPVADNFFDD